MFLSLTCESASLVATVASLPSFFVALSYARARRRRVCLSVRLTHDGIDSKLMTTLFSPSVISWSLVFYTNFHVTDPRGIATARSSNETRVVKRRKTQIFRPLNRYVSETIEDTDM